MFTPARAFIGLCVALGIGAIWLACAARLRVLNERFRLRVEGRISDRERLTRARRDGLLQDLQGLLYEFQSAADRLATTEPSRGLLERALQRGDQLIADARSEVALDETSASGMSLSDALNQFAVGLVRAHGKAFRATVQGTPVSLQVVARDELFRIGSEALTNAFIHSVASRVEMEIVYDRSRILLRVRDDGCGFDVKSLSVARFGLMGMQERARRLQSRADIWSRPGSGTEVSVRVAAACAYREWVAPGPGARLAQLYAALRATD